MTLQNKMILIVGAIVVIGLLLSNCASREDEYWGKITNHMVDTQQ